MQWFLRVESPTAGRLLRGSPFLAKHGPVTCFGFKNLEDQFYGRVKAL
jgi:hypothetical protein